MPDGTDKTTANATKTTYDAAGRAVRVERWLGVALRRQAATAVPQDSAVTDWSTQYRKLSTVTGPTVYCVVLVSAPGSAASVTRTQYDDAGRVVYTMDARGSVTGFGYDGAGRRVSATNYLSYAVNPPTSGSLVPDNTNVVFVTQYGYDGNGNQVWVADAEGRRTDYEFDELNRQVAARFPLEAGETVRRERRTTYDLAGRKVLETDEAGVKTGFGYDALGQLTSVTNDFKVVYPVGDTPVVTTYGYDEIGNQIWQRDALGRETRFEHDPFGRRVYRILPGTAAWPMADSGANLSRMEKTSYSKLSTAAVGVYTPRRQVRDFRGLVNTFDGDLLDRAATNYFAAVAGVSAAKTNVYTYGPAGRIATLMTLTASTATCRTNFYAYNGLNQLRKKDCPEGVLTYDYDGGGNLTNLQAFQRTAVAVNAEPGSNYAVRMGYGYDAANRLTSVTNGAAVTRYTFDKVGNLLAMAYPNGITNLYQYNLENRLTSLVWKNAGTTVASFAYTLGPTGLRTSLAETVNGTSRTHTWAYNSLYRLTSQSLSPTPNGNLAYQYDPVGNRTSRSGTLSPPGAATAVYNALDGLTTDTYDSNGNTVSGSTLLPGATTSGFDAENRMVTLANGGVSTTMVYDPEGNRVSKTRSGATTWYLVDDRNPTGYPQVILEQTVSGGTTNLSNSYVYGLDLISQGPATSYYICDGLGSTRALASAAGTVQNTYTYDAYGTTLNTTGATANNYLFAGEQFDPDLGLYYLRARYLQPNSGRFWTMDSFEGAQETPRSQHKYLYAEADPANHTDPSGLAVEPDQARGEIVHELFYAHCVLKGIPKYFDAEIGAVIKGLTSHLKPDVLDVRKGCERFFELKPISYRDDPFLHKQAISQIASYTEALKTASIGPGESLDLAPSAVPIGIIYDPVSQKVKEVVIAAAADVPGLLYYWLRNQPDQYEWLAVPVAVGAARGASAANSAALAIRSVAGRAAIGARAAAMALRLVGPMITTQASIARF